MEIFFAIIATSLALISVFMPILFLGGNTGRLFQEFGVVIAGAVAISSFVALTLTPMLSTKILQKDQKKSRFYHATEPFYVWLNLKYKTSLESFLERRWLAFVVIAFCGGLGIWINQILPQEIAPMEDRGQIRIFTTGPEGATYEYMDAYVDEMIREVQQHVPELDAINTVTSPGFGAVGAVNSAMGFISLTDRSRRDRSQQEIAGLLGEKLGDLTAAQTFVSQPQSIGQRRAGLPVQYVLQAQTLDQLKEVIPGFLDEVRAHEVFTFGDVNLKFNRPELQVNIDRDRARALGVSTQDIARTLQLSLSGSRFGYFIMGSKQYWVIGQMEREHRSEPVDLKTIYVRNDRGGLIQMDNLVEVSENSGPPQLYRFNRFVSATISAALSPGYTIGDGIAAMDDIAAGTLDERIVTDLAGPSRDFTDTAAAMGFIFAFALVLVYLVLAAQFESFRDPFIILFTVPLALFGSLLALWYFGETLNIFSQIGMIMLIGLVTKNGILIVEFANQRQDEGMALVESIKDAAAVRFRPILMTSLSTVLGILPIALAFGAGSESRISMGVAVISGLIIGSFLTLYVIPAIYTYFATTKDLIEIDEERLKKAEELQVTSIK